MKARTRLNIILFFLITTALNAQELSLNQAVQIALKQNESIKRYKSKVEEKSSLKSAAFGNYLPTITVAGGYTYLGDDVKINTEQAKSSLDDILANYGVIMADNILGLTPEEKADLYNKFVGSLGKFPAYDLVLDKQNVPTANIVLIQPLFTGGKITAGSNFAEAEFNEASIELTKTTNEIIQSMVDIYLGIAMLEQVVLTRQDVVSGIKKHKAMAQKLFAEGIISKYHVLRADVAVAEAETSLEDDENNLELAYLALKSTMGVSQDTVFVLTDSLKYYNYDLNRNAAVDSAYTNQPLLQLIDQKKIMVDQKKNLASSKFWPTIFAFGEVGFFRRDFPGVIQPPWMVGIQANWEIFSGFRDYEDLQAATHLENQLLHAKRDAKNKIKLWINKSYTQAINAKTKYEKSETIIKLAQENLRMSERRFEEGFGTSLEVIDANMMLEGERVKRLSSLYNYYKALNELFTAAGEPTKIIEIIDEGQYR